MHSADPGDAESGRRPPRRLDLVVFGFVVALSAYVFFDPSPPGEAPFRYADKVVHAVLFLAVAWTGARAGLEFRALAIGLVAYAIGSEVIQYAFLSDRSGDLSDVAADLVGAAAGLAIPRSRGQIMRARAR